MKNRFGVALALTLLADPVLAEEQPKQQITKHNQHTIQNAPAENFSGTAQFSRLPTMPSDGDVAPATVTFSPGAITHWHIHPDGQYLIVIDGEGRTQEWGKPIQNISKGDVIWCPPGVKHWHGAAINSPMTHIALSPVSTTGAKVSWLEKVELPQGKNSLGKNFAPPPVVLTSRQLSLIPIAAFTATGDLEKLKPALVKGLENGLTVNEIKEALAHQYAYAGFPRSLNGLLTFKSLLEQRAKDGISDTLGKAPTAAAMDTNYYEVGTETLSYLTNAPADKPLVDNFSPTIDYALKAHLFGYLFSRDNLGYLEREIVVVSTLAALGDVNAQLTSHLRITRNLGVDNTQMQKIMKTLEQEIDPAVARNAQNVLQNLK